MQVNPPLAVSAALSAALVVSVAGIELSGTTATAAPPTYSYTATKIVAADDAFVAKEAQNWATGSMAKLVAQNDSTLHKQAYLKFVVPKSLLNNGGTIESAVLNLTAFDSARSVVSVKPTNVTTWTEANVNYTNAPAAGTKIATMVASGGASTAVLTPAVTAAGTYSFQLSTTSAVSRYYSSESTAARAPTLTVTVRRTTTPPPPTTPPPTTPPPTTPPPTTPPPTTPPPTTPPPTTPPPTTPPPTTPPPTTPPPTTPPPTTTPPGKALLGMSAPASLWSDRVDEVGDGLQARRLFFTSFGAGISLAQQTCDDGMYPVMSFKAGSYTWAQVAAGNADGDLRSLATRLAALSCDVFVAIHHEPEKDGTAADWSAMQVHALPLLGPDADVKVGVIGNGWWWSSAARGYSDAEIAAWVTPGVRAVSDVIAGDTYQGDAAGEQVATKINNMGSWARRVGGVKALGLGEFNTQTAQGLSDATAALGNDRLFAWGCLWNADGTGEANATVLTGDRLEAFQAVLADW